MRNMIIKIVVFILPTLFCVGIKAQTFEYLYNTPVEHVFTDVVELDSSFLFVGAEGRYPTTYPLAVKVSKIGTLLKDTVDYSKFGRHYRSILKKNNQDLLLVEMNAMNHQPEKIVINSVNERLDSVGLSFEYKDTSEYIIRKSRMVSDSQMVVVGTEINNGTRIFFALLYNIQKHTAQQFHFQAPLGGLAMVSDVLLLNGKYYFFKTRIRTTPSSCVTGTEIARFNTDLTHDTSVAICNSVSDSIDRNFYHNITAQKISDSTFMMVARADENSSVRYPDQIGHLIWDTNFTEMSAKLYGKTNNSVTIQAEQSISRFQNDLYVYLGGTENYKINPSGYDTVPGEYFLIKTDLNGDTLWTRYYSNNTYVLMSGVKATSDGGALMYGTSYDYRTANGFENDVWIVKVDSNGNYQTSTALKEQGAIPANNFRFFPNPMKEELNFRQLNEQHSYSLKIMDVSGREVSHHLINSSDYRINVSALSAGMYIYYLTDENGNYASGKLVKK